MHLAWFIKVLTTALLIYAGLCGWKSKYSLVINVHPLRSFRLYSLLVSRRLCSSQVVVGISTVNWMLIFDKHPNYASILLEKQGQKAFSQVITLIPGQELCQWKNTLPKGLCITRFSPRDNEPWRLSSIYFHFVTVGEYTSLKKTAEGDRKFGFSVLIYLFLTPFLELQQF